MSAYTHPYDHSPPSSPRRKRPRLSSSEAERSSSQDLEFTQPFGSPSTKPLNVTEDPFMTASSGIPRTKSNPRLPAVPLPGFASASSLKNTFKKPLARSPSPETPLCQDDDAWFKPAAGHPSLGFQAATSIGSSTVGFISLTTKAILAPSAAALAKAKEKMKELWDSDSSEQENVAPIAPPSQNLTITRPVPDRHLPTVRPALNSVENSLLAPDTPSPAGFVRPSLIESPLPVNQLKIKPKPFQSPLVKNSANAGYVNSPLNPRNGFASALGSSQNFPSNSAALQTPTRPNLSTRNTPAPFVTPFKPGMRPGEPGWQKLQDSLRKSAHAKDKTAQAASTFLASARKSSENKCFFNTTPPANRKTLAECGLRPQQYDREDFEVMDINIQELQHITPSLAQYYSFHTTSTLPPSQAEEPQLLGPAAALKELHDQGCTLATKAWVENHWCLILWKLAGMVALDPDGEDNPSTKRWCWAEVKRQLLYRYERELNEAKRPPLRLISTEDAPAACPMALCISNIFWVEDDSGRRYPELEVTDGWYRLKAQIDAPMSRAVSRCIIRIGRKIGVVGAKLSTQRKEPQEILEAYNSVKLVLTGNSTHLLPWHAKLGFMLGPCISTMHSLTADGGSIAAMDVVVVKSYPIAFLEFKVDGDGKKYREGPRGEADEMKQNEEWKRSRERISAGLWSEFEQKRTRHQSYVDRLERRAGPRFHRSNADDVPDHIEGLYDQLEVHEDALKLFENINAEDAGWLAMYVQHRLEADQESEIGEIEKTLEAECPPRDVRSFRIVVMQDSRTCRRPANRIAQVTVWDVMNLTLSEGAKPGLIDTGNRFLITHLIPTQQSAWMGSEPGAQIFLSTTRFTRWRRLKT